MESFLRLRQTLSLLVLIVSCSGYSQAQAPTNLTVDVALVAPTETDFAPSSFFSSTTQIVAAFNSGRRAEETQLGLAVNSLGFLILPGGYATASDNQRA